MILSCHKITKQFGEETILRDISFHLEEHEKTALTGVNGAGKSTLLRIITGEMQPDAGEVQLAKGRTLGYLAQQQMLTGHLTIYQEMREAKKDVIEMEERLRALEITMKTAQGAELSSLMESYHRLTAEFERSDGYALESEITGVLRGLGFSDEEFSRQTDTLSGGEKTRVALGKLLLRSPDVILLDEPTNHLDIHSIAWLENYLLNYRGTVLIVSHDRYFLDRVVSRVMEIEQGTLCSFEGNYTVFAAKKKALRDERLRAYLKNQQEIRHQEEVIAKLRSFNREKSIKRAESREKMLARMQVVQKPAGEEGGIHLTLNPSVRSGDDVLSAEGLSCRFGSQVLFTDLSFLIRRGERVALIGDNGAGKTTILKIINDMIPAGSGQIRLGSRVHIGYYDQEHQLLHPEKTLFEEISDAYPDLDNTTVRSTLAAFLFTGDDVFKQIRMLSGGERGRVALAKLMLSGCNFLILDEPTNHLDILSREILEDALTRYTGTVLCVSHDRYFINRTATRILCLENGSLTSYPGNYDYYLEKSQAGIRSDAFLSASAAAASGADTKQDWERQKDEQARIRKRRNDLRRTEEEIEQLEGEDADIDAQLSLEEVFTDLEKCMALTGRKAEIAERLEALYAQWEKLAEE